MDPCSLLESWLIREAGFWILTRRKETDLGDTHAVNTSLKRTRPRATRWSISSRVKAYGHVDYTWCSLCEYTRKPAHIRASTRKCVCVYVCACASLYSCVRNHARTDVQLLLSYSCTQTASKTRYQIRRHEPLFARCVIVSASDLESKQAVHAILFVCPSLIDTLAACVCELDSRWHQPIQSLLWWRLNILHVFVCYKGSLLVELLAYVWMRLKACVCVCVCNWIFAYGLCAYVCVCVWVWVCVCVCDTHTHIDWWLLLILVTVIQYLCFLGDCLS